jgi:hypothetical protein
MFNYTPGNDPFTQQGQADPYDTGDRFVGRVMAEEYNLAVQNGQPFQAVNILARVFGFLFQNRFSQ